MQLIASRSFLLLASPALGMVSADDTIDRNRALKRHSFIAASVNALQNNTWRAGVNLRFLERRSFGVDLENNAKEYARALREGTLRLAQEPSPEALRALPTEFDSIQQWPSNYYLLIINC